MAEEPLELAHTIVEILEEKKGENILLLDLSDICSFTDYFVICSGGSERTLRGLAEVVQQKVKKDHNAHFRGVEGDASSGWVLLDYGDVILHLFAPTLRAYYQLEELWRDGQVVLHMQ